MTNWILLILLVVVTILILLLISDIRVTRYCKELGKLVDEMHLENKKLIHEGIPGRAYDFMQPGFEKYHSMDQFWKVGFTFWKSVKSFLPNIEEFRTESK